MTTRKPLVCANWKLHHFLSQTLDYLKKLKQPRRPENIELVVAPVAPLLWAAADSVRGTGIEIAAQNVFFEKQGAFTGEWSVEHVRELGCKFAIVGHSERRQYFGETDEIVAKKVKACFEGGITPMACVGESLDERQNGKVNEVLQRQVDAILSPLSADEAARLVIAYEPIWAIGTGLTASAEAAQEVHSFVRSILEQRFDAKTAQSVRIIYGGSVKADNAAQLAREPDIDGALVGGASLNVDTFLAIASGVATTRASL